MTKPEYLEDLSNNPAYHKRKAESALVTAKEIEQKRLKQGYKYVKHNGVLKLMHPDKIAKL